MVVEVVLFIFLPCFFEVVVVSEVLELAPAGLALVLVVLCSMVDLPFLCFDLVTVVVESVLGAGGWSCAITTAPASRDANKNLRIVLTPSA